MTIRKPNRQKVRAKKISKPKLKTIPQLKNKLWRIFSEYTRIKNSDSKGYIRCITCNDLYFYKDPKGRMQSGHYIPKKYCPALYFEESNVNPQCSYCNSVGEGMQYFHAMYIINKYGQKELDKIHKKMNEYRKWRKENLTKPFTWQRTWLQDKILDYEEKLKIEINKRK